MKNERGAGRKPKLTMLQIEEIRSRREAGERVQDIAYAYGISRQALSKYFSDKKVREDIFDFYQDGVLSTRIWIDFKNENIRILNYAKEISKRAFVWKSNPTFSDFVALVEQEYLRKQGIAQKSLENCFLCLDVKTTEMELGEIISTIDTSTDEMVVSNGLDSAVEDGLYISNSNIKLPSFHFGKRDLLLVRTDTDGYQLKAITDDRRFFVKSQAVMGGILMDDWAVEIIASDLCEQLDISCVKQYRCRFVYGKVEYQGIYSCNFELDGYIFYSFESLLETVGQSSDCEEFISLSAIDKLRWCSRQLSTIGNIDYDACEKYMLDLAIIDCLVGNVDRHTKNFGLFYNVLEKRFEIPLLFDNGMGLFEHDYYKEKYQSYTEAMNNVYVSPYGEDPFDMLRLLHAAFDLKKHYPKLIDIKYKDILQTDFSKQYMEHMIAEIRCLWGE